MTPDEVRNWRSRMGLSQAKAAELLGVRANTIARYEQDVRNVPVAMQKHMELLENTRE